VTEDKPKALWEGKRAKLLCLWVVVVWEADSSELCVRLLLSALCLDGKLAGVF
jgi:hypothetical protein